jgi:hypothetical protein
MLAMVLPSCNGGWRDWFWHRDSIGDIDKADVLALHISNQIGFQADPEHGFSIGPGNGALPISGVEKEGELAWQSRFMTS